MSTVKIYALEMVGGPKDGDIRAVPKKTTGEWHYARIGTFYLSVPTDLLYVEHKIKPRIRYKNTGLVKNGRLLYDYKGKIDAR